MDKGVVISALRIQHKMRRWHRRWPHWLKDLLPLISYVNFFGLLATVIVLALAPRHFFRRLGAVLNQKKAIYRTPVAFFINGSILFYLLFSLRHVGIEAYESDLKSILYMLILIPLTPVLMAALAGLLWFIYQLPRLIPVSNTFPQPNPYPLFRAISLRTYRNLDWFRYFWGLFYFSLYFITSWQFAMLIAGYLFKATGYLVTNFETDHGLAQFIIVIVALICAAAIIHWLVYRPYAEMLRCSLKLPLDNIFLEDSYEVGELVEELIQKDRSQKLDVDDIKYFCISMEEPVRKMYSTLRVQNQELKIFPENLTESRFEIIHGMLKIAQIQTVMEKVDLSVDDVSDMSQKLLKDLFSIETLASKTGETPDQI